MAKGPAHDLSDAEKREQIEQAGGLRLIYIAPLRRRRRRVPRDFDREPFEQVR